MKSRTLRPFRCKEYLVEQYVTLERSAASIAAEHNVTPAAVTHWMRKHEIPRRNVSECRKVKYWRGPKTIKVKNPWRRMTNEENREYWHFISLACPEKHEARKERILLWQINNREKYEASKRKHQITYAEEIRVRGRESDRRRKPQRAKYARNRRKVDLNFRLASVLRGRVGALIRGADKSASTMKLLGCSLGSFKLYLESRWESEMSWDNYGRGPEKWNIDHIMPCAIFDLNRPEHQKRCFHFSNCQPMWSIKNSEKNAKVLTNQFNLL